MPGPGPGPHRIPDRKFGHFAIALHSVDVVPNHGSDTHFTRHTWAQFTLSGHDRFGRHCRIHIAHPQWMSPMCRLDGTSLAGVTKTTHCLPRSDGLFHSSMKKIIVCGRHCFTWIKCTHHRWVPICNPSLSVTSFLIVCHPATWPCIPIRPVCVGTELWFPWIKCFATTCGSVG